MDAAAERQAPPVDTLDAVDDIVIAYRWAKPDTLKGLRAKLGGVSDPQRWVRLLIDEHVLDADRAMQIDLVQQQQRSLPRFRLLRKLGAGGMGTVWLARLDGHDKPLALKVINARLAIDSDFLGRFLREARALQGLHHPHIADVIDAGGHDGTHYLAMEYINGPSLGEMLKQHKALPEAYVLRVIHQVAEGLAYVNQAAGLVHRDVKPENILVQRLTDGELFPEDDVAKLIDFGLVKNANDDEHLTQTGMTIGTPLYMSPEQVRGEKLDARSDIYALGATMYHLLTGSAPFKGTSPGAIMSAHLTEAVPDPGNLVPSLADATRRVVTIALAKSINDRFRDFPAFIKAIAEAEEAMHEKHGTMRLLRKPLVIAKKPLPKKSGTDVHAKAEPVEITERIARKHGERQSGRLTKVSSARLPVVGANRATGATAAQAAPTPALTDAGHISANRALTERRPSDRQPAAPAAIEESVNLRPADLAAPVTNALVRGARRVEAPAPAAASASPTPSRRSAVFDENPDVATGFGVLPWMVLTSAVLIAIGFAVWHLLF